MEDEDVPVEQRIKELRDEGYAALQFPETHPPLPTLNPVELGTAFLDQANAMEIAEAARENSRAAATIAAALRESSTSSDKLGRIALRLQHVLVWLTVVIAGAALAQVWVTWQTGKNAASQSQVHAPADSTKGR